MKDRVILHCDMNNFYASVELMDHPELRGKPVAVAGDPENRHGIILAKSQEAKKLGVVTAETIGSARRKCPDLILLPPHHEKYHHYSKLLNEIYLDYTDQVEPFSVDESWLDVTESLGLFGSADRIAAEIHERVQAAFGLTLSIGISWNKIFAKMGSEYRKPDATTAITRENYRELLWPMPACEFFFVGKATAERLQSIGIRTIGDLAAADERVLQQLLGISGPRLARAARGEDDAPVRRFTDPSEIQSVGHGMTFRRNLLGRQDIGVALTELADRVSTRMRRYHKRARGVKVEIVTPEFKRISRQKRLSRSIAAGAEMKHIGMRLIEEAGYLDRPIRLLTLTAIELTNSKEGDQLSLFSPDSLQEDDTSKSEREEHLEETLDLIREKFGSSSIRFGHAMRNDLGIEDDLAFRREMDDDSGDMI